MDTLATAHGKTCCISIGGGGMRAKFGVNEMENTGDIRSLNSDG